MSIKEQIQKRGFTILGISVSELLREDEENMFTCPKCGAKLKLVEDTGE